MLLGLTGTLDTGWPEWGPFSPRPVRPRSAPWPSHGLLCSGHQLWPPVFSARDLPKTHTGSVAAVLSHGVQTSELGTQPFSRPAWPLPVTSSTLTPATGKHTCACPGLTGAAPDARTSPPSPPALGGLRRDTDLGRPPPRRLFHLLVCAHAHLAHPQLISKQWQV